MMKINLQKNKGPVSHEAKGFRSGFVILFAVTVSAILLAVALGVANIAFREVKFGTSAKDTNDAFFAADTGIEYVLFHDKTVDEYPLGSITTPPIVIYGLGNTGQGCAKVTVDKTDPSKTIFISKGYNDGGLSCTQGPNSIEREIKVTY